MEGTPLSLQHQCLIYLVCHLEEASIASLALLPSSIRSVLMENLPVADVCRLEDTDFVRGLDTEEVWKTIAFTFPVSQDFPEQHFRGVYKFESMKDYFFTYVYHLVLTENVPAEQDMVTRLKTQRVQAMVSGSTPEGFHSFCKMIVSLRSCAAVQNPASITHLIFRNSILKEPFVPHRYTHFLSAFESGILPHPMASLVLQTCSYRPRAAQVNCTKLSYTELYQGNAQTHLLQEIFKEVRYLQIQFSEVYQRARLESCQGCMQAILPVALQSTEHLRIYFKSTFAVKVMICSSLPAIYSSVMAKRSKLERLAMTIHQRRPGESDLLPSGIEEIIQSLSNLFKSKSFSCLILEGISFQLPDVVPSLLKSFLSQPCTATQRLVLSRITMYSTPSLYPSFLPAKCSYQHKELKFHKMSPPVTLFDWLLGTPGVNLKVLEFLLEGWHPRQNADDLYEARDLRAKKTALQACATNHQIRVKSLSFHLHLFKDERNRGIFHSLFHNSSICSLDFTCCNLGRGDVLANFTSGLEAHREIGTLTELNLSKNDLGLAEDEDLSRFFHVLFSLPQLSELTLNLSDNRLVSQNFEMMHSSWEAKALGTQLSHMTYNHNRYVNMAQMKQMAKSYSVSSSVYL